MSTTRPATPRELKRYGRQATRRYAHMAPWRSCRTMFRSGWRCPRCLWRTLTGDVRRSRKRMIAARKTTPLTERPTWR